MSNKYWVGGTGSWTSSNTTNWATSSGGAGGAAVPANADDVYMDGNSGTGTITITSTASIVASGQRSLTCTGYTGTLSHPAATTCTIGNGSSGIGLVLVSGMTYTIGDPATSAWLFDGTTTFTLETGGHTLGNVTASAASGSHTMGSNVTCAAFATGGSLVWSLGGFNLTCTSLSQSGGTLTLSTGTVNCSGTFSITAGTVSGASADIIMSGSSPTFAGNGNSYGTLDFTQGSGTLSITGANTFGTLKATAGQTLKLPASTTTTISSASGWSVNGRAGTVATLNSSTPGTKATLSVASGTVTSQYLSLMDSAATGGATFIANNSNNVSDNSGWNIQPPGREFLLFM